MKRIIGIVAAVILWGTPSFSHDGDHEVAPWQKATSWPDRIVTTFKGDPTTAFAVTWRTDATVARTVAQIVKATPDARFDLLPLSVKAVTERLDLQVMPTEAGPHHTLENHGLGPSHYHSVEFTDLEPNTLYAWRVRGARGIWSEWFQTKTAANDGPVSFVYFGDAQAGIRSHWSRVIRMAQKTVPDAGFFLHAGDLVMKVDSDLNWAEWFDAGDFIHAQTQVIPVNGNHEFLTMKNPETPRGPRVIGPMWRPQFTLPVEEELPENLHETVYDIRYNKDLHVFVLNSTNDNFRDQAAWLDKKLTASDAKWKIVSMHHPFFAPKFTDRRPIDANRRKAFMPIVKKHKVDMVLAGHIHLYSRFTGLPDGTPETSRKLGGEPSDVDTVYVISSSGAKMETKVGGKIGKIKVGDGVADYASTSVDRMAENTQMFQVIHIDGDTLRYEARNALGQKYDEFSVSKTADGKKRLREGAAAFGDQRLFDNSGKYIDWWDMR